MPKPSLKIKIIGALLLLLLLGYLVIRMDQWYSVGKAERSQPVPVEPKP